jgi:hypothetical protein
MTTVIETWQVVPIRKGIRYSKNPEHVPSPDDDARRPLVCTVDRGNCYPILYPHGHFHGNYKVRSVKFPIISLRIVQELTNRIDGLRIVGDVLVISDEDMFISVSPADDTFRSAKRYTIGITGHPLPLGVFETIFDKYRYLPDNSRIPVYKLSNRIRVNSSLALTRVIPHLDQDVLTLISSFCG